MGVDPDDAEPAVAGGEPFDGSDMSAAAAAEDERHGRQDRRERQRLLGERRLLDGCDLRERELEPGGLDHRFASLAPRGRHAHQAGREGAPARVALEARLQGDGRERPAVGAAGPQARHV